MVCEQPVTGSADATLLPRQPVTRADLPRDAGRRTIARHAGGFRVLPVLVATPVCCCGSTHRNGTGEAPAGSLAVRRWRAPERVSPLARSPDAACAASTGRLATRTGVEPDVPQSAPMTGYCHPTYPDGASAPTDKAATDVASSDAASASDSTDSPDPDSESYPTVGAVARPASSTRHAGVAFTSSVPALDSDPNLPAAFVRRLGHARVRACVLAGVTFCLILAGVGSRSPAAALQRVSLAMLGAAPAAVGNRTHPEPPSRSRGNANALLFRSSRGERPLPGPVVRGFDPPARPWLAGHRGIDIAGATDDEVVAPQPGIVRFAGLVAAVPTVSIAHDDGLVSTYQPVTAVVAVGDAVGRGDVIGTLATGPHCLGTCLHLGAKRDGDYVNPYVALRIWARLLPYDIDPRMDSGLG